MFADGLTLEKGADFTEYFLEKICKRSIFLPLVPKNFFLGRLSREEKNWLKTKKTLLMKRDVLKNL
jgi:hypothetical protein